MSYEKTSNKDPTSYTKAADLQQLKEELELLRKKRKSRRHSQLLATPSTSSGPTKMSDSQPQPLISPQSPIKDSDIIPLTVNNVVQSVSTELSVNYHPLPKNDIQKEKSVSLSSIPLVGNDSISSTETTQNVEEHSILIAKLKSSTKRAGRRTNRLRVIKDVDIPSCLNRSEEDDLTTELLLTAFQNLSGTKSTPVCKSRYSNSGDLQIKPEAILKPTFSTSSSSCSSWQKQSSLTKLKSVKGKVSTVINALENNKTTTVYRGHKENNRPPRPLVARYELPSPHHQQSFNIDLVLPLSTSMISSPLRALPKVEKDQIKSNESSPRRNVHLKRVAPSSSVSTPNPSKKQQANLPTPSLSITIPPPQPLLDQKRTNKSKHARTSSNSTLRPLPSYTPQLSPSAGECQLNLNNILPSSEVLLVTTPCNDDDHKEQNLSPLRTSEKLDATRERSPPKPPRHQWRQTSKEESPLDEINSRPLRVVNINNDEDLDIIPCMNTDSYQRQQQYSSAEDDTTDSSMSDDLDEGSPTMTSQLSYAHQRKRYSDDTYFDHRYDHHITNQKKPEHQKKVSFSSIVTTIPSTELDVPDYPKNTRGFWEAFTAEMGHQQRPEMTLLDQMDAIKLGVKYLPPSVSQQQYHKTTSPIDPSSSSTKLFGIHKLLGKTRNDEQEKTQVPSPWWKSSKKPDPVLDVRPLSVSPPLDHPTKNRPKKPSSFRKTSSYTKRLTGVEPMAPAATAQPQWRQRVPVSKHYHHT